MNRCIRLFFLLGVVWCVITYTSDQEVVALDNVCEIHDNHEMPVKGIFLIPHITLPDMADMIISRSISNCSNHPIKLQIIVKKIVSNFNLNHTSPFLPNDNSKTILEYGSMWLTLKKQESVNMVTASCAINAFKSATYKQALLLKLRVRIADKKKRAYIKNKYKNFDITNPLAKNSFRIDLKNNEVTIKSFV